VDEVQRNRMLPVNVWRNERSGEDTLTLCRTVERDYTLMRAPSPQKNSFLNPTLTTRPVGSNSSAR
jgi:hypothetical protein